MRELTHERTISTGFTRLPFTILIDVQEKHPWTFDGIRADADKQRRIYEVPKAVCSLGASQGDYQIEGFRGRFAIERKSMEDAQGTLLGFLDRRDRFERELSTLAAMDDCAVVVECSEADLIANMPYTSHRTPQENAMYWRRTFLSWSHKYRVPWHFCWKGRRQAEILAIRIMLNFWKRQRKESC